jgi:hypothetical protein
MIYKLKNGGVIKLQAAGLIPTIKKTVSGITKLPAFYKTIESFPNKYRFVIPAISHPQLLDDVMHYSFETINVKPSDIFRNYDIGNISYTPQQRFDHYKDLDRIIKDIQIPNINKMISDYNTKVKAVSSDPVLKHIVDVSPQYLDETYRFVNSSNGNIQDFVRDLVQRTNVYRRTMNLYNKKLKASDFLTFGKNGTIDVEAAPSYRYGSVQGIYIGHPELTGDVTK